MTRHERAWRFCQDEAETVSALAALGICGLLFALAVGLALLMGG